MKLHSWIIRIQEFEFDSNKSRLTEIASYSRIIIVFWIRCGSKNPGITFIDTNTKQTILHSEQTLLLSEQTLLKSEKILLESEEGLLKSEPEPPPPRRIIDETRSLEEKHELRKVVIIWRETSDLSTQICLPFVTREIFMLGVLYVKIERFLLL